MAGSLNSRRTCISFHLGWTAVPLPQTVLKPDQLICWNDTWICQSFYNLSRQEDRHLITLGPVSTVSNIPGSLPFFSLYLAGDGLICITLLLFCLFLGSRLFHWKLVLEEPSQQKLCVELSKLSHSITMLRKNRSKLWNDVLVFCFVRRGTGRRVWWVCLPWGKCSGVTVSLHYIFSEVANNQDLHRIKDPVNIWKSSLSCFCIL